MLDDLLLGWAELRTKVQARRRAKIDTKIKALKKAKEESDELQEQVRKLLQELGTEGVGLAAELEI